MVSIVVNNLVFWAVALGLIGCFIWPMALLGKKFWTRGKLDEQNSESEYSGLCGDLSASAFRLSVNDQQENAEQKYLQAVAAGREAVSKNEPEAGRLLAGCLANLARLQERSGQHDKAEQNFREALEILEVEGAAQANEYVYGLDSLAFLLWQSGRLEEAVPLYTQALDITASQQGTESDDYVSRLTALANVKSQLEDDGDAERVCREAVQAVKELRGEDDILYSGAVRSLMAVLHQRGREEDAKPYFDDLLELSRKELEPEREDADYAQALSYHAGLLHEAGELREAGHAYRRAQKLLRSAGLDTSAEYAVCLSNYARLLRETGHSQQAERNLRQALSLLEETLGADHEVCKAARDELDETSSGAAA
ncbi:tetratricopeptide repeat protein [Leisingera sp. S132]|uniref:tetratricopeptide repeat protein n=1 Tax=Leisingera sp. S132 TaxID=2867016 RepID=UPI0021A36BD0|nr:tetratricopeptide repeat protein [Leisingera sp. S132]UWQ80433.1 tetratricopeptide repeat protein [Leisingera sp. S132]